MKKLKNKTFLLLIFILTTFLMSLFAIYNVSIYRNEYQAHQNRVRRISSTYNQFLNVTDFRNPLFMDTEVYIVSFNTKGNIKKIISYTNEGLTEKEILALASKNIEKAKKDNFGNLYFQKYVFSLNNTGDLIIMNNTNTQKYLVANLYRSFFTFMILEVVIVYVSNLLTKWLVKPVEETFDKQKQFVSDASHELKTPISIIMASVEALEEDPNEEKWLQNIKSESERMNKLVVDLLDLSKTEDWESKVIYQEENLSKLVESKALSFESVMFEHHLTLDLKIETDIFFSCHADQIKELLSILIDNAIQHGYEESKITISLVKNKEHILLSVTNRGDAILKEEQEKIFERFYRGDKSRNRDSNRYGLGLAIAKNIVTRHHGNISVRCENGYTTFLVEWKQN